MEKFLKIRRILILILVLNWLAAFSKIIYGFITKCASMTADGFHSFGDGASNVIGLAGIWAASKPRDKDHPYGHKKFETVASLGIGVILFIVSFNILRDAFFRIFSPVVPEVTLLSFIVLLVTLIINVFVMRYEYREGKELSSDVLIADSHHTKSDVLASCGVLGTLVAIKLGFLYLDIIIAGIIGFLIAKTGFDIFKVSCNVLCDRVVLPESNISKIIEEIDKVESVHAVKTRGRCDDIHADIHVVIDGETPIDEAHDLSHEIENILKEKIKGITRVNVHVEPNE